MLNVFITVDVEVWCDGWDQLDAKFSDAFQRYIYGRTAHGNYGLPYQLQLLGAARRSPACSSSSRCSPPDSVSIRWPRSWA